MAKTKQGQVEAAAAKAAAEPPKKRVRTKSPSVPPAPAPEVPVCDPEFEITWANFDKVKLHFKLTDQQCHDALVQIVGPDTRNDKFWDNFKTKPKQQQVEPKPGASTSMATAPPSAPHATPAAPAAAAKPVFVMPPPTPHTVFIPPGAKVVLPHEVPAAPAAGSAHATAPATTRVSSAAPSAEAADAAAVPRINPDAFRDKVDEELEAEYDALYGEGEEEEDDDADEDVDGEEMTSPGGGGKPDSPTPPGSVVNAGAGSTVDQLETLPLEPVEPVIQPIPKEDPGRDARKSLEAELRAQATPVRQVSDKVGEHQKKTKKIIPTVMKIKTPCINFDIVLPWTRWWIPKLRSYVRCCCLVCRIKLFSKHTWD